MRFAAAASYLPEFEQETDVQRSRREMAVFDKLSPEARAAFREARQQFGVRDVVGLVQSRGCLPAVKEALQRRGLLPYQVGTDGVVALTIEVLDEKHTRAAYEVKAR